VIHAVLEVGFTIARFCAYQENYADVVNRPNVIEQLEMCYPDWTENRIVAVMQQVRRSTLTLCIQYMSSGSLCVLFCSLCRSWKCS
jgi:lauroyl/myristoyl acyltransferase